MKIPRTFMPEKDLEDKINQLEEEPKTNKKECEKTPYNEELEKLLAEFNPAWIDYDTIYSKVKTLAEKAGYTQIKNISNCEYLIKPTDFGESYVLVIFGKKFEKHYIFARLKEGEVKKFYNRLEYRRKMVYPKSFLWAGLAISGFLSTSYLFSYYPQGTFLKDMLSWMMPSMLAIPTILSIPRIIKYIRSRTTKGLEKYCIGMITGDDKKALEAAFS